MKKILLTAMAVAMASTTAARTTVAQDDELQPLLMVWAKSFDQLIGDIDFIGEASDNPDLGQGLEGLLNLVTQGQELPIDKTKPWGGVVSSDGFEFKILGFLPITDLEKIVDIIGNLGEAPEDEGDGVYRIALPGLPVTLFMKQVGDWTFVSQEVDAFDNVPENPVELLGGIEKQYDFGFKAYVQNIPEIFRQMAVEQIKLGMDENLPRLPEEGDAQFELRSRMMKEQFGSITEALDEIDQVTIGMTIDREKEIGILDVIVTAVEGSASSDQFARMSEGHTKFGGFFNQEATVTANANFVLSSNEIDEATGLVESIRSELMKQIDGLDVIPDEEIAAQLKELVGEFIDVAQATVDSGRIDAGMSLLGEGPFNLVLGTSVAEGDELGRLFENLVDIAESEAGFYGVQLDVAKHKGVRFHTLVLPYFGGPEGEMLESLFGSDVEFTFGLSKDAAYLAVGTDGVDHLKKAIDKSEELADKKVPPAQIVMAIGPLLDLLSEMDAGDDPLLSSLTLEVPEEDDRLHIVVKPVKNGMQIHIEAEKGVLGAVGTAVMTAAPQMGIPGL